MQFSESFFYLLGLITGKGTIFEDLISIEFPHKNKKIGGIGHCPLCNDFVTKPENSEKLKCKNQNCQNSKLPNIDPSVRKNYDQPRLVYSSLNEIIIPFLKKELSFDYQVLRNSNCTILTLNELDDEILKNINFFLNNKKSFYHFEIHKNINDFEKNFKIEFVNGLMDVCGTPNVGAWNVRQGINGYGRMRSYFQIDQRNWKLPVQIDNFLRDNFNIPTQKFDWGHPNIRDGNLKDYYNSGITSAFREHQVGFYPEYFQIFSHKLSPKKELFNELLSHNLFCVFEREEDWLKSDLKIKKSKIKAYHPMENHNRLPIEVRKHFDAQWQINLSLGCKYLTKIMNDSYDQKIFELTGITEETDKNYNEYKTEFHTSSKNKTNRERVREPVRRSNISQNREVDTYPVLMKWLKNKLDQNYGEDQNLVFDTSENNLNQVIQSSSLDESAIKKIDEIDSLNIRPDVVGYLKDLNEFIFIESKIVTLGIKELGQILAYCKVANPIEAYLITTSDISRTVLQLITLLPDLFFYSQNKKLKIGILNKDEIDIVYE